jgi:hypothetical protein
MDEYISCASCRIPIIPLIVYPNECLLLDSNAGIMSTRYVIQTSCMGLYPRYVKLIEDGHGAWFCASDKQGRLFGLSSVRSDDSGKYNVEGFVHPDFPGILPALVFEAIRWVKEHNDSPIYAQIAVKDADKQAAFESAGFHKTDKKCIINAGSIQIDTIIMGYGFE